MAALVGGQKYGLSSLYKNSNNKTLIFVKLTDSALKSIEECVNDKNCAVKPTIQFKSNNGVIRLPTGDSHVKSYGFNISNVEPDGPQGSFECLRQETTNRTLDSLGCMLYKMHINANEDSYEKTRVKMAAVEKENKKFCTKEIKPSGSYVGRKVKLKRPMSSIPPRPSSPLFTSPIPKMSSSKPYTNTPPVSSNQVSSSSLNSVRQVNGNKKNASNLPELKSQSCRNRIIHLLALRPYKKPELLTKLYAEGIKEKEKKCITPILSQIAVLKDHSFVLANHAWNEIQDDWKFYTQEEADVVKTRKYQILNPSNERRLPSPTSINQSQSNQKRALSEWETNNNDQRSKKQRISHINRVSNVTTSNNSLRADVSKLTNGEKSEMNSHHVRKDMNGHVPNVNSSSARKEISGRYNDNANYPASQKFPSNLPNYPKMNGVHRETNPASHQENGKMSSQRSLTPRPPKNEVIHQNGQSNATPWPSNNRVSGFKQKNGFVNDSERTSKPPPPPPPLPRPVDDFVNKEQQNQPSYKHVNGITLQPTESSLPKISQYVPDPKSISSKEPKGNKSSEIVYSNGYHRNDFVSIGDQRSSPPIPMDSSGEYSINLPERNGSSEVVYTNGYHRNDRISNDRISDTSSSPPAPVDSSRELDEDSQDSLNSQVSIVENIDPPEAPEYVRHYLPITNKQQRNRYKEDFNADYEEYKILHERMISLTNKFSKLEQKLHNSPYDSLKIRQEILMEYYNSRDLRHKDKDKLHFLHGKLSHIKGLVMDYDRAQSMKS